MKRIISILIALGIVFSSIFTAGAYALAQSPEELFEMGMASFNGDGVEQDYERAFSYFLISGEIKQYPDALNMLGICYRDGKGTEQNTDEALACFQRAAELGSSDAVKNLEELQAGDTVSEVDYNTPVSQKSKYYGEGNQHSESVLNANDDVISEKTFDRVNRLIESWECTYDENGKCVSQESYDADGVWLSRGTYEYNAEGKLILFTKNAVDEQESTSEEYEYNIDGSYTSTLFDVHGAVMQTAKYDKEDRILSSSGVSSTDAHTTFENTYTYRSDGSYTYKGITKNDEYVSEYVSECDAEDKIISSESKYTSGTNSSTYSYSYKYDDIGRKIEEDREGKSNFDDEKTRSVRTFSYDSDGSYTEEYLSYKGNGETLHHQQNSKYCSNGEYQETVTQLDASGKKTGSYTEFYKCVRENVDDHNKYNYYARIEYDANGQQTDVYSAEETYYADGTLSAWTAYNTNGHRISESKQFRENGVISEERTYFYNTDATLGSCFVVKYDENGNYIGDDFQDGCDVEGHHWVAATCDKPKTCSVCGKTEGSALDHKWKDATEDAPKTCTVCGKTEGKPLEKSVSVPDSSSTDYKIGGSGNSLNKKFSFSNPGIS